MVVAAKVAVRRDDEKAAMGVIFILSLLAKVLVDQIQDRRPIRSRWVAKPRHSLRDAGRFGAVDRQ
jgi:hypothetical protein